MRNQKLRFCSQVTYTWKLATAGFFGPTSWFLRTWQAWLEMSPVLWLVVRTRDAIAPPVTRKERGVVKKSGIGRTTGSTLSIGLAATTTNLTGPTAGTGAERNCCQFTYVIWVTCVILGTECLEGQDFTLPHTFYCHTGSGLHFSPNSRHTNKVNIFLRIPSGHPPQIMTDQTFQVQSSFHPSTFWRCKLPLWFLVFSVEESDTN